MRFLRGRHILRLCGGGQERSGRDAAASKRVSHAAAHHVLGPIFRPAVPHTPAIRRRRHRLRDPSRRCGQAAQLEGSVITQQGQQG